MARRRHCQEMLLHSRGGSVEHRLDGANALVEESLDLADHGARAENRLKISLERSLIRPLARSTFSAGNRRALLNLISNGSYAATPQDGYPDSAVRVSKVSVATRTSPKW